MKTLETANNAILLGRGVEEVTDGTEITGYRIGPASKARVDAMTDYYYKHRQAFGSYDSVIVASGGYARLAANQVAPPLNEREGMKMADLLIQHGVPHNIIQVELESGSTTENFERTIAKGYFDGKQFDEQTPLLVVASKPHGRYRGISLARAAFGISDQAGVGLLTAEPEPLKVHVQEYGLGLVLAQSLREVNPAAFSEEDMASVGLHFEHSVSSPLTIAHAGITQVVPMLRSTVIAAA